MKSIKAYPLEILFLLAVGALTVTGFWNVYFREDPGPGPHHHLHLITNSIWLLLLFLQLVLIGNRNYKLHRKVGLSVLIAAPLLVASAALLSVHSAHKGIATGQGDALIVQNVTVTLELAFLIILAFVLRKNRKLHGSLLLSTAMLFMGIAMFFTLISFIPGFKVDGPETFYRFQTSGMAAGIACLIVGFVFLIKDYRNNWPLLLAAALLNLNELVRIVLAKQGLIEPLTEAVGSLSQSYTFIGSLVVLSGLIAATGVLRTDPKRLA